MLLCVHEAEVSGSLIPSGMDKWLMVVLKVTQLTQVTDLMRSRAQMAPRSHTVVQFSPQISFYSAICHHC